MDSRGNLFGTTPEGGVCNYGTVFEIVHGTNAITTLASFNGTNGANPYAGVTLDTGGDLFGTTRSGGSNGNVFEIVHGTAGITALASFNGTNGAYPDAGVTLDASGDLFGTTYYGGANNAGTVFEIICGTNAVTTLVSFNGTNGADPDAGVTLDASGDLLGTTEVGGINNEGSVFESSPDTSAITPLNVSLNENGGYTFAAANFTAAFSNSLNNPLQNMQITSLPVNGQLTLNGIRSDVEPGDCRQCDWQLGLYASHRLCRCGQFWLERH